MRELFIAILASTLFGCNFYIKQCATAVSQSNAGPFENRDISGSTGIPGNTGISESTGISPKLVYHQGCALRYPGNSWPAIECAVKERAPIIEIDVRPARDGELFLFHDRRINLKAHSESVCIDRICPSIALSSLTSGEIGKWRYKAAGEQLSERAQGVWEECQRQPLISVEDAERGGISNKIVCRKRSADELRILRFDELLQLPLGQSNLLLDMKGDDLQIAKRIIEIAKETSLEHKLIFSCSRGSSCLEELKRLTPKPKILFRAKSAADVARALPHQPEIIQIDKEWSTPKLEADIKASVAAILIKALTTAPPHADYVLVDR